MASRNEELMSYMERWREQQRKLQRVAEGESNADVHEIANETEVEPAEVE